ncbi:MAG: prolyl oligopeptidase family serine peptidase [Holophaga sp.]|nr:prolyl oligopeptidase family serine peptidase [Holophaga sp.]
MRVTPLAALICLLPLAGQDTYQKPNKAILEVLDAPNFPAFQLAPGGAHAFLVEFEKHPMIRDLARPMLRLAGARVDPQARAPHGGGRVKRVELLRVKDGVRKAITLPAGPRWSSPAWSPDGSRFYLTATSDQGVSLYLGETATAALRKVPELRLNASFGGAVQWMAGSQRLLVKAVPKAQGPAPRTPDAPAGPRIQENFGKSSPVKTFQDLLQNQHDEALFAHYATSQVTVVEASSLKIHALGKPGLVNNLDASPDGRFLLVATLQKPFSYVSASNSFPHRFELWDAKGAVVRKVHEHGLLENIPNEGVQTGPRNLRWVPVAPATLQWVEALDEGDPKKEVPHRDRVMALAAPFQGEAKELLKTEHRFAGLTYSEKGDLAVLREVDRKRNWNRTWLLDPTNPTKARLFTDLSSRDRYKDPGNPVMKMLPNGGNVIRQEGRTVWLTGSGASPKGDLPFLDRLNLDTLKSERLFQCREGWSEGASLQADGSLLIRRENQSTPPNVFLRSADGTERALTNNQDPAPILRQIRKERVRYKRPDGVELSFTMYLPPDFKKGQPCPTLVWAYPQEFTSASDAGQVSGNANRFTSIGGISQVFMALAGYVVLDDATMPVVGDPVTVNNTFLEQIVASAKAAIDKAAELGVTDPTRVAVGGHSYGAFMTANLLAHCDLFKAGIARSGAYNRTLTPFGFQSERRSLWEAPDMYLKVSPFMSANKFHAPILLIHGEVDNNMGTFPIQSERLFQALKGNGQNVRYVTLPHESHGYSAKESVMHTLWEMETWLGRNLK